MTARRRSVCDEEWVRRKRRHLGRQVLSKHLSLPLRQREMESGGGVGVYLVRGEVTSAGEWRRGGRQSTSLRSLTGSSCTMLRWFMARLKATWTALRMLDVRPSIILILSMVLSRPRGTILDLGSHCLRARRSTSVREAGALPTSRCSGLTSEAQRRPQRFYFHTCWRFVCVLTAPINPQLHYLSPLHS